MVMAQSMAIWSAVLSAMAPKARAGVGRGDGSGAEPRSSFLLVGRTVGKATYVPVAHRHLQRKAEDLGLFQLHGSHGTGMSHDHMWRRRPL